MKYILHMTYFPVAQSFKKFVQGVILCQNDWQNKMYIMNELYIILYKLRCVSEGFSLLQQPPDLFQSE